jgi:hypothetical protein
VPLFLRAGQPFYRWPIESRSRVNAAVMSAKEQVQFLVETATTLERGCHEDVDGNLTTERYSGESQNQWSSDEY